MIAIEPFETLIDIILFSTTASAINRNKSRDLFRQMATAFDKKAKYDQTWCQKAL